jgi:uncharacterized RDD family membrane protein YckC
VIPSALTGRTLGKRLQKLKVLREDGTPLGWGRALLRYGPLVLVSFLFFLTPIGPIGAVLVVFGVTMWTRNNNRQGFHDRIAHTIVVTDAPQAGGK